MQVQAIESRNSNVNFKSQGNLERALNFITMDDAQLKFLAYAGSKDKEQEKKNQKSILKTFLAIPIVDSIGKGILLEKEKIPVYLNKGPKKPHELLGHLEQGACLNKRLAAAGGAAAMWALGIGVVGLYEIAKQKVLSKSPTLRQFDQSNPVFSFLLDIGIITSAFLLALTGISKLSPKPDIKTIQENKLIIDESTRFLPKTSFWEEIAERCPRATKASKSVLKHSVWILLGVGILQMIKQSHYKRKKVEKNYLALKDAQLRTAKNLINALDIKKDIAVQNQKAPEADLRYFCVIVNDEKSEPDKEATEAPKEVKEGTDKTKIVDESKKSQEKAEK